jgi:hypothetical protein
MSSEDHAQDAAERKKRRRRAAKLGDLLPDTTSDESDEGWNEKEGDTRDDEMRRDVPPHHG